MERLTQKDIYGMWYVPLRTPGGVFITTEMIYERLAAYEETGLEPKEIEAPMVRMRECLYVLDPDGFMSELPYYLCRVDGICTFTDRETMIYARPIKQGRSDSVAFKESDLGKIVFRTKEEVEARIRKAAEE